MIDTLLNLAIKSLKNVRRIYVKSSRVTQSYYVVGDYVNDSFYIMMLCPSHGIVSISEKRETCDCIKQNYKSIGETHRRLERFIDDKHEIASKVDLNMTLIDYCTKENNFFVYGRHTPFCKHK